MYWPGPTKQDTRTSAVLLGNAHSHEKALSQHRQGGKLALSFDASEFLRGPAQAWQKRLQLSTYRTGCSRSSLHQGNGLTLILPARMPLSEGTLDRAPGDMVLKIVKLQDNDLALKLMEMGCLPGQPLKILHRFAGGKRLIVQVLDYVLALRASEAEAVWVTWGTGPVNHPEP